MRRTEAREAGRMAMFLNILNRWEPAELNQEEAVELLGRANGRFGAGRAAHEEDGEAGGSQPTERRRWSGFIASAIRASRSSISTSIW